MKQKQDPIHSSTRQYLRCLVRLLGNNLSVLVCCAGFSNIDPVHVFKPDTDRPPVSVQLLNFGQLHHSVAYVAEPFLGEV